MQVESGVRAHPVLHERTFMGGVVIAHDMHAQFGRNLGIDCGQELLELSRPVAAMGGVGHGAVSDVGRGEQSVSNGVCKGWVSLRKETHCWLSTRRRVMSGARFRRRALSV